jgi:hypothetical protein
MGLNVGQNSFVQHGKLNGRVGQHGQNSFVQHYTSLSPQKPCLSEVLDKTIYLVQPVSKMLDKTLPPKGEREFCPTQHL